MARFRLVFYCLLLTIVSSAALSAQGATQPPELIGPGDVVRLRIWREPDMSGDFPVAPNGTIVLPRLGDLNVRSMSSDSLRSILTGRYRTYLNNPSIEVTLLRRVTIAGAVRNPGVYPLDPTLTISDAIALAGGPASDGKRDQVEIRRSGRTVMVDLRSDTIVADSPIQSGDQLYVPTRSWLSRNTWLISVGVTVTALIVREANR